MSTTPPRMLPAFHSLVSRDCSSPSVRVCRPSPLQPDEGSMLARWWSVSVSMIGRHADLPCGWPGRIARAASSVRLAFTGARSVRASLCASARALSECGRRRGIRHHRVLAHRSVDDPGDPHPSTIGRVLPSLRMALTIWRPADRCLPGQPVCSWSAARVSSPATWATRPARRAA